MGIQISTFLRLFFINLNFNLHFLLDLNLLAVDLLVHLDRVTIRKMVPDVRNKYHCLVLNTSCPVEQIDGQEEETDGPEGQG